MYSDSPPVVANRRPLAWRLLVSVSTFRPPRRGTRRLSLLASCLLLLSPFSPLYAAPAAAGEAHRPAAQPSREDAWASMLAGQRALAVSTAFDREGRLWRVRAQEGYALVDRSDDLGASFGPAARVNPEAEVIGTEGDNRPKIAIAADGTVYVSYTRLLGRPFSGDIRFSRSLDGGRSFSAPLTVNDDRDIISHRFDSLLLGPGGEVYIAWLDKRDETAARRRGAPYAGAALYYAVSADRGARFEANVKLADHSCECCRIALALAPDGVPRAFWRHVYEGNERDHALMRLDAKDAPRRITHGRWRVEACPHHGPALAIAADGVYHYAWFDNGPGAQGLFYARSADGGAGLSPPMPLGEPGARPAHPAVIARGEEVYLAWKEFDGLVSPVRAMRSRDGGLTWSAPVTVAQTEDASDHPQLAAHGDRVFLSWNTLAEGYRLIPLQEALP